MTCQSRARANQQRLALRRDILAKLRHVDCLSDTKLAAVGVRECERVSYVTAAVGSGIATWRKPFHAQ
jgi:hypothetical protein